MRRALLKRWPALMADYGLKPWEMDRLTLDELEVIVRHQNDRWEAIRRQNDELQRMQRGRRRG